MLLVLVPLAFVRRAILGCQSTFAIFHVIFPLTLISVLFPIEKLSKTVSFVGFPLTVVKVLIVIVAMALTFSQVLLPLAMVLVICSLLLIRAVENAITIPNVSSFCQDLSFIMITIAICVSRLNPATVFTHLSNTMLPVVPLLVV